MITKHKIVVFLISLVAAALLWIFVVTTIAPDASGSVSGIHVSVTGDTILEARGLIVTGYGTETVRVDLSGARATLSKLNATNMMATLDVSHITEAGEYDLRYTISFPDTVNSGEISIKRKSVDTIHITVSTLSTKTLRLELNWDGQVKDGYLFDAEKVSFSPDAVVIKGPTAEIDLVESACLKYDVSELEQSAVETLPIVYLDKDGDEIMLSSLVTASIAESNVSLPILRWKDIELNVLLDYGDGTGISEENVDVTLSPDSIRVTGEREVIELLSDSIELGSLDLTQVGDGDEFEFPIPLPAGVNNVSGETVAVATVSFTGLRYVTLTVSDIQAINMPADYEVTISNRSVNVTLRGSKDVLQSIREDDVHIIVDLSGYTQSGTYTVPGVVRIEGDPAVGKVGAVDLTVTLS